MTEFGVLAPLVADPLVTDVFVNGPGEVWLDRGDGLVRQPFDDLDDARLRELAVRLISHGGRHVDEASPCVDVRLHDGIRVHAVLPPISPSGTLLSIRLPRVGHLGLDDLAATGLFDSIPLAAVTALVRDRANILISGAGGSGKTTLLSAILSSAPTTDRIVAIEDVAELLLSICAWAIDQCLKGIIAHVFMRHERYSNLCQPVYYYKQMRVRIVGRPTVAGDGAGVPLRSTYGPAVTTYPTRARPWVA